MTRCLPFACLVAAVCAGPASARGGIPDAVVDGMYVTLAEVRAKSEEVFRFFAGPGGGPIPKQAFVSTELPQDIVPGTPAPELLAKLFEQLDANGDGKLTRAEWNARLARDLGFADQNEDGRVTLKELSNARENMSFGEALGLIF